MLGTRPKMRHQLTAICHSAKYYYRKQQMVILLFCSPKKAAKKGVLFRVDSFGVLWSLLNFVVASKIVGILAVFPH